MTDQELEAHRALLEKELGETLRSLWEQLTQIWPLPVVVETMMLLGVGVLSDAYTPHQVIERLGVDKHQLYDAMGKETPQQWRRVIQELGYAAFVDEVHRVLPQSASTRSRVCFTIILDDSLFRRYAKQIASIFKWWGGAFKAVRCGARYPRVDDRNSRSGIHPGLGRGVQGRTLPETSLEVCDRDASGVRTPREGCWN